MTDITNFYEIVCDSLNKQFILTNIGQELGNLGKVFDNTLKYSQDWFLNEILNIDNCSLENMQKYWCNQFNIPYYIVNENKEQYNLTEGELRFVIKCVFFKTNQGWTGSGADLQNFISQTARQTLDMNCLIIDSQKMFIYYSFKGKLNAKFKEYLIKYQILPSQAGVGIEIWDEINKYFGYANGGQTIPNWLIGYGIGGQEIKGKMLSNGDYFDSNI